MTTARANLDALAPPKRSKTEQAYEDIGEVYIADEFGARVEETRYEPLSFRLVGGWYKPDYMHILASGQVVLVEVKSRKGGYGYTNSRAKIRAAAELYPFFTWVQATGGARKGFELEVLN